MRLIMIFLLSTLAFSSVFYIAGETSRAEPETRAVWLSRDVVQSGSSRIYDTFRQLSSAGFNRVLVNVHYFGGTIYPSDVVEAAGGSRQLPEYLGRDPLQECIDIGKEFDLEVVTWFEYGLMAYYSASDTGYSGPILALHPDWEAIDIYGQHWQNNQFGNFHWMDAAHPDVVKFITDLFCEVATNYPELGGIETDRIRYPGQDFSYSDTSVSLYTIQTGNLDPSTINPSHPEWPEWLNWREAQTTYLAGQIYKAVKRINPALHVSSAVAPPYMLNQRLKLQAWDVWADSGFVDALEPMLYVNDSDISNQLQESIAHVPPGFPLYPGVAYQGDASLEYQITTSRNVKTAGVTVWYYSDLTSSTYEMLTNGIFALPAALPHNDLISDDSDPLRFEQEGNWQPENEGFRGTSLTVQPGQGESVARWRHQISKTAPYHIFARWVSAPDRATNALYRIQWANKLKEISVNQTANNGQWVHLLTDTIEFGQQVQVDLDNTADGTINADAIRLVIPKAFDILDINAPDSINLEIRFNRSLDKTEVENTGNYIINPDITIHNVYADPVDDQIVRLSISAMKTGQIYQISITGLKDIYGNILPQSDGQFSFNPVGTYFEVDNRDKTFKTFGSWARDSVKTGFYGSDYEIAVAGQGENRAQWWAFVGEEGHYEVSAWWPANNQDLATNAEFTVLHRYGTDTLHISQRESASEWIPLGVFPYAKDNPCSILLTNKYANGNVVADAIRIRRVIASSSEPSVTANEIPSQFVLYQNYPNPFNPGTTISFDLKQSSRIQITLYDAIGRQIQNLASGRYQPGNHSIRFQADRLASGVYYYRLVLFADNSKTAQTSGTKKMLLIK